MLRDGSSARISAGRMLKLAEQPGYWRAMPGVASNFRWRSRLHDATALEDEHAIAEFEALFETVSHQHDRRLRTQLRTCRKNFIETACGAERRVLEPVRRAAARGAAR